MSINNMTLYALYVSILSNNIILYLFTFHLDAESFHFSLNWCLFLFLSNVPFIIFIFNIIKHFFLSTIIIEQKYFSTLTAIYNVDFVYVSFE